MDNIKSVLAPKAMRVLLALIMICGVCLPMLSNPKTAEAATVESVDKTAFFDDGKYVTFDYGISDIYSTPAVATGGSVSQSVMSLNDDTASGTPMSSYKWYHINHLAPNGVGARTQPIFVADGKGTAANGASVSFTYDQIGTLRDAGDSTYEVPVGVKVTVTLDNVYSETEQHDGTCYGEVDAYSDGRPWVKWSDVFASGFLVAATKDYTVKYEFFDADSKEALNIDQLTYCSASNDKGEGLTVDDSIVNGVYVSRDAYLSSDMIAGSQYPVIPGSYLYDKTAEYGNPTFIGCPPVYDFTGTNIDNIDAVGSYSFYWRSVAFNIDMQNSNTFECQYHSLGSTDWTGSNDTINHDYQKFNWCGGYWSVPNFMFLTSVKPPAPTKTVSDENVVPGQDLTFTVSQKVNSLGVDSNTRYTSFKFIDKLDSQVSYKTAKVTDPNGATVPDNAGKLTYDANTHTVTYEFSSDYLENNMLMAGGTYNLVIDTTVNTDASSTITNTPITNINGTELTGDPVDVGLLTCEKSSTPVTGTTVAAGEEITYHLDLSLTDSDTDAENVAVRDYIPEHTTYVDGSATEGGTYDATSDCVNWNFATFAADETKTVDFTVVVDEDVATGMEIKNMALYEPNHPADDTTDPKTETNETVHPVDSIIPGDKVTVYKTSDPVTGSVVEAGQAIKYTLTAVNTGEIESTNTLIRDEIPEGTTYVAGSAEATGGVYVADGNYVEWVVSNIGVLESEDVSFSVTVNQDTVTAGDRVVNFAKYLTTPDPIDPGDPDNPDPIDPTDPTIHPTDPEDKVPAVVQVVKSSIPVSGTTVNGNTDIAYTLTVKNVGGENASDAEDVYVLDYVPEGTIYVDGSVSALNDGAFDATKNAVSWTIPTLAVNEEVALTFNVTVTGDDPTRIIENQALYEKDHDPASTEDPKNESNIVAHPEDVAPTIPGDKVTVYKTSDPVHGTVVEGGQAIKYTLTAVNTGEGTSTNTIIRDTIPTGTTYIEGSAEATGGVYVADGNYCEWVVSALEPTASEDVSFSVTVDQATADAGKRVVNVATYGDTDKPAKPGDPTNPVPTAPTNQTIHPTDPADMVPAVVQVIKTSDPVPGTTVNAGTDIAYTLTVKNVGGENASDAEDVYVLDYIPEGTTYVDGSVSTDYSGAFDATKNAVSWTIPTLAVNEEVVLTFKASVGDNAAKVIENQALYEPNHDPNNMEDPENESNIVAHPFSELPGSPYDKTGNMLAEYWWVIAALALVVIAGGGYGIYQFRRRENSADAE